MGDNIRYKMVPAGDINKSEVRTSRKADGWKFNKKYSYIAIAGDGKTHNYWTSALFLKAREIDSNLAQQCNAWYATSYATAHKCRFDVYLTV